MKKGLLLLFNSFALSWVLIAQNPAWILAPRYTNNITSSFSLLPVGDYSWDFAGYAQNIQRDASGNILFFIVDSKVYDRNGNLITYYDDTFLLNELNSYQRLTDVYYFDDKVIMRGTASEIVVVPDKNDCSLFSS